jgi:hypothetical protein
MPHHPCDPLLHVVATRPDRPRLLAPLGAELIVADAQPILLRVPAAAFPKAADQGPASARASAS